MVYEGKYYESERLFSFLMLQSIVNPDRQICLIKMATDPSVQKKYVKLRSGPKPTNTDMYMQNTLFKRVLATHYDKLFPNVYEVTVTDPEKLSLTFQE